jgi:flagellar hook-length control protein FliK
MSGVSAAVMGVVAQSASQRAPAKVDDASPRGEGDNQFMAVLSSRMQGSEAESTRGSSSSPPGNSSNGDVQLPGKPISSDKAAETAESSTSAAGAGLSPPLVAAIAPSEPHAQSKDLAALSNDPKASEEGGAALDSDALANLQKMQTALFAPQVVAPASGVAQELSKGSGIEMDLSAKSKSAFGASNKPSVAKMLAQSAANLSREAANSAAIDRSPASDLTALAAGQLKGVIGGQSALDLSQVPLPGAEVKALAATMTSMLSPAQPGQMLGQAVAGMGEVQARALATPVQLSVDVPLRSQMFAQALGDRVAWMSGQRIQIAEISLNPAHLGPLEVRIAMSGGEMGAQFFSPHAQVREALDAALPRLREMLADAGVTLGQANVREESLSRQSAFDQSGNGRGGDQNAVSSGLADDEIVSSVVTHHRLGGVDLYV